MTTQPIAAGAFSHSTPLPWRFAVVALFAAVSLGAAAMAAAAPVQLSIWSVFLFAGPHNWMEARYLLARMPVRWASARIFYIVAIAGVLLLAALWQLAPGAMARAVWHTALAAWVVALAVLRGREAPRFDWFGVLPLACLWSALAWWRPSLCDLVLVFAHPLVALWFLDRQIRVRHPEWLRTWRGCLALIPLLLLAIVWHLANASPMSEGGAVAALALRSGGAGAGVVGGASGRLLVATHAYLELTHYAVWILALPLLGLRAAPWRLSAIPLVQNRQGRPRLIRTLLAGGAFAVLLLWFCFWLNYDITSDLYFRVAILHVLAEAPFLLRML